MPPESVYQNRLLDVEYIQETLDGNYHYTEETKGRDLIIIIGNTGVGKSTVCNYLLGYRMKELTYKGRPVIETVFETPIKIGHEVSSETLYAKSFVIDGRFIPCKKNSDQICLLDCPGFFGNKTVEDKVIESISTELAVRSARQIKGILILISLNVLMETRVKELRELVKTLISLFKDPLEMVEYSVFVITKKYKYMPHDQAKEITLGALGSLKDYCENQATRFRENPNLKSCDELTYIDYDRIATYFSVVLKKKDDIIFIDPLDNGESRKLILNQVHNIKPRKGYFEEFAKTDITLVKKVTGTERAQPAKPININDFCFSEGNEDRVKFYKVLYDRAREGINFIREVQRCSGTNGHLYSEILNCQTRLSALENLRINLEEEIHKTGEGKSQLSNIDFESIKVFESMIVENDKKIESKKKEIVEDETKIKKASENLEKIDTDIPKLFVEKSITRNVPWWKFFGWEEMDFTAETSEGIKIIKVEKEMENGYWKNEIDEREKGIYKIRYESRYHARPAKASVKTYIKTKDAACNHISIEKMKSNLSDLINRQTRLKSEVDKLSSENQALRATVAQANINKEEYKKSLMQKLKDCEKDIQRLNTEINTMQQERKRARLTGMTYTQEFMGNRHKYDITVSISALLGLSSVLIKSFVSQYNEFLSCVDSYISSFDESAIDSSPYVNKKESEMEEAEIFSLKDPITGQEIKDLVVTSAGTAFDEHSLLAQFDKNLENPLPFEFTREDGSTEVIQFLRWQKVPDIQNYIDKLRNEMLESFNSSPSVIPSIPFIGSQINKLSVEELQQQEAKISEEIKKMRDEIEIRETDLEKVTRHCERLKSEMQDDELPQTTYALED